ncbi:BZ3500_MvSof-1268-A1-R1_Chr1-3g02349 [Microbotryum saponariae]|uniref:BZ3500_MvSof-1268-A1-R1_Chr1-3g02349 protein n=1 Tax=Microbotryum saponariae TaxID=289078 RepID=A0A2X0KIU4_9BASI|nr:BZ3500_MvSof-1268-A1-R1_Chr1-3g02349 [Microbotryum saponariae]SCZ96068.1 BZ3501_MvSof-1269-A2-R1_Chr1-3g01952 [Microbotryum saponariae]
MASTRVARTFNAGPGPRRGAHQRERPLGVLSPTDVRGCSTRRGRLAGRDRFL